MHEEPLFEDLPPVVEAPPRPKTRRSQARVRRPVRNQIEMVPRALEESVADDHPARAIWAYLEQVELEDFYSSIEVIEGEAGRPATDPQVLLGLWLLATSEGVGSARRLARLCDQHDAYRWVRGGVPINYHMLADFRVAHRRALDELLTRILATLMNENLVSLSRVAQDGMRVRASAGAASFRAQSRLEVCLAEAHAQVERLAHAVNAPDLELTRRQRKARERAAREVWNVSSARWPRCLP
jgi:transposase